MGVKSAETKGEMQARLEPRQATGALHVSATLPLHAPGEPQTEGETTILRQFAGGFCFGLRSILTNAPAESGVYLVYSDHEWIYVGESSDIRSSLLRHLNGENPSIVLRAPTRFAYQLLPAESRAARQSDLILEVKPPCNQRAE